MIGIVTTVGQTKPIVQAREGKSEGAFSAANPRAPHVNREDEAALRGAQAPARVARCCAICFE